MSFPTGTVRDSVQTTHVFISSTVMDFGGVRDELAERLRRRGHLGLLSEEGRWRVTDRSEQASPANVKKLATIGNPGRRSESGTRKAATERTAQFG